MSTFRGQTLPILASLRMNWQDLFLLFLISRSLQLEVKIKYEKVYRDSNLKFINNFNVTNSYIKPLAKYPNFGLDEWNLPEIFWTIDNTAVYLIKNGFQLIYGGNEFVNPHMHIIHYNRIDFAFTKLPQLPFEGHYIVTRHPLAFVASFDPLLPLDLYSWVLSFCSFVSIALLLIFSHYTLRSTKMSLYHFSECWRNLNWFKTSSCLLSLWAITFFLVNNAYQTDFRTGLISQDLEKPINSWNDIDIFDINVYSFFVMELSPVSIRDNIIAHQNLLEQNLNGLR